LLVSFALVAFGNEYTVMIPALQEGWPRLLQSYKLYGVLVLWVLLLWSGSRPAQPKDRFQGTQLVDAGHGPQ